jgi:hypothetical protein
MKLFSCLFEMDLDVCASTFLFSRALLTYIMVCMIRQILVCISNNGSDWWLNQIIESWVGENVMEEDFCVAYFVDNKLHFHDFLYNIINSIKKNFFYKHVREEGIGTSGGFLLTR